MTSTTSLLHTALQNLHVAQQVHHPSHTPRPPSSSSSRKGPNDSSDEDEYVAVGRGTAPGTPIGGRGMVLGQRIRKDNAARDPLRLLPTHVSVRIFLQLDVRSLARCDRVCKRWQKSSTLNYVWFLQTRALQLPSLNAPGARGQGAVRKLEDGTEFFDPYEKTLGLAALAPVPVPTSTTPQWSKAESKRAWKAVFHTTLARDSKDDDEDHPYHVDIASLHSSGYTTPSRHSHAGGGSGHATSGRWGDQNGGSMTPTERKVAAREGYKALGGRKSRAKRRMGGEFGARDKGGAGDDDDPRFTAPW